MDQQRAAQPPEHKDADRLTDPASDQSASSLSVVGPASASGPRRRGLNAQALLQVQRRAGNRSVVALVSPPAERNKTSAQRQVEVQREVEVEDWVRPKAQALYECFHPGTSLSALGAALTGDRGPERVLAVLRTSTSGRPRIRPQLTAAYEELSDGESLLGNLTRLTPADMMVTAVAMYFGSREREHHVEMAKALWGAGTDTDAVQELIFHAPWSGRQALKRKYDHIYKDCAQISQGLLHDLEDDLSGWLLLKAKSLLYHRSLNEAETLFGYAYNDRDDQAISILERHQEAGTLLTSLWTQWRERVNGGGWTGVGMEQWLYDELSGDHADVARAIFSLAREQRAADRAEEAAREESSRRLDAQMTGRGDVTWHPSDADRATARARRRRLSAADAAARQRLTAALNWSNDVAQAQAAADDLREAYRTAAEEASREERQQILQQWRETRSWMDEQIRGAGGLEGDEATEFVLRLHREPTAADKVYFKIRAHDKAGVLEELDKVWGRGTTSEFRQQAGEEVWTGGRRGQGRRLRPAYLHTLEEIRGGSYEDLRIGRMTQPGGNATVGAARISLEVEAGMRAGGGAGAGARPGAEGAGAGGGVTELLYKFLRRGGSARARAAVRAFVASGGSVWRDLVEWSGQGVSDDRSPELEFVLKVDAHFYSSFSPQLRELIAPAADDETRAIRARRHGDWSTSGWQAPGAAVTATVDAVTGEDHAGSQTASIERLEAVAAGTDDQLLDSMAEFYGVARSELGAAEQEAFHRRLEAFRAARAAAAEVTATIVEIAVELAVTACTGGGAAPALAASLASLAAGIAAREAMLGEDYESMSRENAERLATAIATAGTGAVAGSLGRRSGQYGPLRELLRSGALGNQEEALQGLLRIAARDQATQAALNQAVEQATTAAVHQMFADNGLDRGALQRAARDVLAGGLGSALGSRASGGILGDSESLVRQLAASFADNAVQTLTTQTASLGSVSATADPDDVLIQHYVIPLRGAMRRAAQSTTRSRLERPRQRRREQRDQERLEEQHAEDLAQIEAESRRDLGQITDEEVDAAIDAATSGERLGGRGSPPARTGDTLHGVGPGHVPPRTGETLHGVGPGHVPPRTGETLHGVGPAGASGQGRTSGMGGGVRRPRVGSPLDVAARERFDHHGLIYQYGVDPFTYVEDWRRTGSTLPPPPHGFIGADGRPRFWSGRRGSQGSGPHPAFPHGASPQTMAFIRRAYRETFGELPEELQADVPAPEALARAVDRMRDAESAAPDPEAGASTPQ